MQDVSTKAMDQWSTRPDDERFETLESLDNALATMHNSSVEASTRMNQTRVEPLGNDLVVIGPANTPVAVNNWSFQTLCWRAEAPAQYLMKLPVDKAADLLTYGVQKKADDGKESVLLIDQRPNANGLPTLRAISSEVYARFWGDWCSRMLFAARDGGFRVPPARPARHGQAGTRLATEGDVIATAHASLGIKVGDAIAPAGLYAGDRNMFAFMVHEGRIDMGGGRFLSPGFFMENSEVRERKYSLTTFWYDSICGNHIVWGMENVVEVDVVHAGRNAHNKAYDLTRKFVDGIRNSDPSEFARVVAASKVKVLGPKQEDSVDAAYKLVGKLGVSRKTLDSAYLSAARDGEDPNTAWGIAYGMTRRSQDNGNADNRTTVDRAAGMLLKRIAF